jgi:hypothetical protein
MTWAESIGVYIHLGMRMEEARLSTIEDGLHPGRIRQPKHAPPKLVSVFITRQQGSLRWGLARRANNGDAFWHHDLVPAMGMQVPTAHKASLCRVCVDPT